MAELVRPVSTISEGARRSNFYGNFKSCEHVKHPKITVLTFFFLTDIYVCSLQRNCVLEMVKKAIYESQIY